MRKGFVCLALFFALASVNAAPASVTVKIIKRQNSETSYSYDVPGHAEPTSTGSATCSGGNCTGADNTSTVYTAPKTISYTLSGATLSLLLPDGRIAVMNCDSKYKPSPIPAMNLYSRRSCRIPIVDEVQAEFSGSNAKLSWPVSLDGKKFESETYKIRAILH
jgi:hypothetical protein